MEIKRGSTRMAVIVGNYVIKFPRLYYLFRNIREAIKYKVPLKIQIGGGIFTIIEAIHQNKTEHRFWRRHKAPFVAPTAFCFFGIVNIMYLIRGRDIEWNELKKILSNLPDKALADFNKIDHHCIEPTNFIKNNKGEYYLVDYGDTGAGQWPFMPLTDFLSKWQTELEKIFISH